MVKNLQAKISTKAYYRTNYTKQSKTFHNSKPGLLFRRTPGFLIDPVRIVSMSACVYVCVSMPKAINN